MYDEVTHCISPFYYVLCLSSVQKVELTHIMHVRVIKMLLFTSKSFISYVIELYLYVNDC